MMERLHYEIKMTELKEEHDFKSQKTLHIKLK